MNYCVTQTRFYQYLHYRHLLNTPACVFLFDEMLMNIATAAQERDKISFAMNYAFANFRMYDFY